MTREQEILATLVRPMTTQQLCEALEVKPGATQRQLDAHLSAMRARHVLRFHNGQWSKT